MDSDPSAKNFSRFAITAPFAICLLISVAFTAWFGLSLTHVLEATELAKQSENVGLLSDYLQHLVDDMLANAANLSPQVAAQPGDALQQKIAAFPATALSGSHIRAIALFDDGGTVLASGGDMTDALAARLGGFAERLRGTHQPIFLPLVGDEAQPRDIPRFAAAMALQTPGIHVVFEVSAEGRKQRAANLRASNLKATLAIYDTATDTVSSFGGGRPEQASDAAADWPLQNLQSGERTRCDGTTMFDRRCIAFRPIEHSSLVMAGLVDRDLLISVWARRRREDQQHLRAALADVKRLYTAKSNFMAHLSHELRTPLNSIIGFSDVMRNAFFGPLDRRYRDYAGDIHAAASHLHGIASDIMDVERLERGELSLEPGATDLNPVVAESARILAVLAEKQGVSIHVAPMTEGPATVNLNRHRAAQIALNLLSNAVKYSEPGDRIDVSVQLTPEHCWSLVVSDEGIGMTAEEIAFSERPFGLPAQHRTGRHDSVGLGLPIVRGLLAATGGRLDIRSEKAKGTTVVAVFGPIPGKISTDASAAPPPVKAIPRRGLA